MDAWSSIRANAPATSSGSTPWAWSTSPPSKRRSCASERSPPRRRESMSEQSQRDFAAFLKRRETAGTAFMQGDAAPIVEQTSRGPSTTFFAPMGGFQRGKEVREAFTQSARMFAGGDYRVEILQMDVDERIAYIVAIQRGRVRMANATEPVDLAL